MAVIGRDEQHDSFQLLCCPVGDRFTASPLLTTAISCRCYYRDWPSRPLPPWPEPLGFSNTVSRQTSCRQLVLSRSAGCILRRFVVSDRGAIVAVGRLNSNGLWLAEKPPFARLCRFATSTPVLAVVTARTRERIFLQRNRSISSRFGDQTLRTKFFLRAIDFCVVAAADQASTPARLDRMRDERTDEIAGQVL